jgi:hypothetical protein
MPDREPGRDRTHEHELERQLRELGAWIEYPPIPDLSRAVRRKLEEEQARDTSRSRSLWANYLSRGRGPEREGARRGPLERRARVLLPDGTRLESQPGKAELLPGGALLWEHEGRALLMRTELSKAEAIPLAASVS